MFNSSSTKPMYDQSAETTNKTWKHSTFLWRPYASLIDGALSWQPCWRRKHSSTKHNMTTLQHAGQSVYILTQIWRRKEISLSPVRRQNIISHVNSQCARVLITENVLTTWIRKLRSENRKLCSKPVTSYPTCRTEMASFKFFLIFFSFCNFAILFQNFTKMPFH